MKSGYVTKIESSVKQISEKAIVVNDIVLPLSQIKIEFNPLTEMDIVIIPLWLAESKGINVTLKGWFDSDSQTVNWKREKRVLTSEEKSEIECRESIAKARKARKKSRKNMTKEEKLAAIEARTARYKVEK